MNLITEKQSDIQEVNMNKYLVLKFGKNEIYVYIVKAENPEYAITLIFW